MQNCVKLSKVLRNVFAIGSKMAQFIEYLLKSFAKLRLFLMFITKFLLIYVITQFAGSNPFPAGIYLRKVNF